MNQYLDIIPTPQYLHYTKGPLYHIGAVCFTGTITPAIRHALEMLDRDCPVTMTSSDSADLIITMQSHTLPEALFTDNDLLIFSKPFAEEQGYLLKRTGGITYLYAPGEMGCVYGIMTLLQILSRPVDTFTVRDYPDFRFRGIKWTIWAETGIWSYDFGDGIEAIRKRMIRKLDQLLRYKINYIHADGFGFDPDRFSGYADIMCTLNDNARLRGIHAATGGYLMSYGMVGHLNSYQGKDFLNRTSYPDGEIYECIGSYEAYQWNPDNTIDRSVRKAEVRARTRGTCLSNQALLKEKMKEITGYLRRTHAGALALHNMDAHEIHPELWKARCPECRKRWPNDDLFSRDGAAGAFAAYLDQVMEYIRTVRDGDFDAARDTLVRVAAPGYLYAVQTTDEDFDIGIRFWSCVTRYMKDTRNFCIGFREEFFYHDKPVRRADTACAWLTEATSLIGNFCGADGFYDDKLFTPTSALNYIMKGYTGMTRFSGNAFQEPLQVYNAEYLWNSEHSGFFRVNPRPADQTAFQKLFRDMIASRYCPEEVFGEGGFIDVICCKLYGDAFGKNIARIYKLHGENGEPPIACASNVDLFTNYTKVVFPMRWDRELSETEIQEKLVRFRECARVTKQAQQILKNVLTDYDGSEEIRSDLNWLYECFCMGTILCRLLYEYMLLFLTLDTHLRSRTGIPSVLSEQLAALKLQIGDFKSYVDASTATPVDKFGGAMVRRREMADFLEYNTDLMGYSIAQNKRIPDNRKPLPTRDWW